MVVEFLEHLLVALVNASENALSVEVVLFNASDDSRVKAFDNLVDKEIELLIVKNVLGHVRDILADLAVLNDDSINALAEQVVVGGDDIDSLTVLALLFKDFAVLSSNGIDILAKLAVVCEDLIDLVGQDVQLAHLGVMASVHSMVQLLVRLFHEGSVLALIRHGELRSRSVEVALLGEVVRGSHGDSGAASLKVAITINTHSSAVVMSVVAVGRLTELNAQAASFSVAVTKGTTR